MTNYLLSLWLSIVWIDLSVAATSTIQECWVKFEDNDVCTCSIHDPLGPIKCHKDSIEIRPCYCLYYDQHLNTTIVGPCLFSCRERSDVVVEITTSAKFNNDICNKYGSLHRKGRFCGQCNESYGLAVYSYQYISCVPCQDYGYKNWLKYFAVALLPLTLFYILAVLMSFNVTSSSLNGIVLVIQCLTSPIHMTYTQVITTPHSWTRLTNQALFSITGISNLDFFRLLYTPFCLHPNATVFQVLSLDYIVALYPFFLIFMTYALVTAYDKQYRILVWIWKPFKICLHRYQNAFNLKSSLIEVFATFIVLSSVKILGVSFKILSFISTKNVAGKRLDYYVTLYDGTEYLGPQHLPFAVLAIAFSFIFVILPLFLLAIYPCSCFCRCLNRCRLTCGTLHVFMDAFQGSYRTEPRDMRYFSAFYLFLRIIMLAQVLMFSYPLVLYTFGILSLVSASIITIFQPYKMASNNTIEPGLLIIMGIYFISTQDGIMLSWLKYFHQFKVVAVIQEASILFLELYSILLVLWRLLHLKLKTAFRELKSKWNSTRNYGGAVEWFDRDLEADERHAYPPLLSVSQKSYSN